MGNRGQSRLTARQSAAHRQAVESGQDAYLDPESGLLVMTASYLERRGRCCRSGCRHCPFRGHLNLEEHSNQPRDL